MSTPDADHDQDLAEKIVRRLNEGTEHIRKDARERLLVARKTALSRYRQQPVAVQGLAWADNVLSRFTERHVFGVRYLIPAVVLVLGLAGIVYWQNSGMPTNDLAEIDMGLLTGDLPIDAYLDRGFESWLKRSSR
ncbi:MAG: DUF3619 family protein [Burkholderiales bacterium]|nr:DUF3619 family protein [Burkholderiales bacterium]